MALGIVKIYLGSPFSANRRCPRSVVVDPLVEGYFVCLVVYVPGNQIVSMIDQFNI